MATQRCRTQLQSGEAKMLIATSVCVCVCVCVCVHQSVGGGIHYTMTISLPDSIINSTTINTAALLIII